jgi:hypothetical protein
VAAASSRVVRQRALVRKRPPMQRRRLFSWFSSAEIVAQPVISAD